MIGGNHSGKTWPPVEEGGDIPRTSFSEQEVFGDEGLAESRPGNFVW